jgi:hypothetical protein
MTTKKTPALGKYGNPQLNIRLDPEIMEQIEERAEADHIGKQEWVKRLILEALGKELPTAIGRSEFETVTKQLAQLAEEVQTIKELESVA